MADYSGYYSCKECGRDGDARNPISHTDSCSIPGQIAKHTREGQLRKDANEKLRIETVGEFEDMTDDEVIASMRALQRVLDFYAEQARPTEKRLDAGREVIRRRPGLLSKYLDR